MGYNVTGMWKYKLLGFTLIEILISIGVMAVLSAGVMSLIGPGPKRTARDGQRKSDLANMVSALEIFRSDNSTYPACNPAAVNCLISVATLPSGSGFTTNYLPVIPTDPTSGRSYRYVPKDSANGQCDGSSTDRCVKYTICAALEKVTAADGNCSSAGACGPAGVNCSYSLSGP